MGARRHNRFGPPGPTALPRRATPNHLSVTATLSASRFFSAQNQGDSYG